MNDKSIPRTVMITGAYGGIGYDLAQGFLRRRENVVLNGRNSDKLSAAAQRLDRPSSIALVAGDIGERSTGERLVATAVERFGSVDVLINNAGIFYPKAFLDSKEDDLEKFFYTNLKGTYLTSQAAARQMVVQGEGGAIINIGTVLVDHAITGFPASAALTSKGAVHALTVSLSAELAPYNIRVNTVVPGVIRTPLHDGASVDDYAGIHPLNRVGEVAEITDAVIYLASATYTTGVILAVDGGYRVGRR
ncbi:MAG TPA: SDR family oxidoreductase [Candidatus Binatia bacterium]|nr:SDR family oxidoreductase [Candidatus Binatia bacterium]